jgi:lipid-binding SYLF domain-containing protein
MRERILTSLMVLTLAAWAAAPGPAVWAGWDPNAEKAKEKEAMETVERFQKEDPDLKTFFDGAYGYAVFPTVGKAGMGMGGAYGTGVVFQRSLLPKIPPRVIGSTSLTQLSMGFQLGAQAYSELIFFKDEKALEEFKKGNYELGAQASAVAVKKGASRNADYSSGVAIFTLAKGGLMAEASVGGQKFSFEPK